MKLYHGTSEGRARLILKQGIKPRGVTGRTNWKHTIESKPRAVYLTNAYALHFAMHALPKQGKGTVPRAAILEIDPNRLNPARLVADEDAMEQAGRGHDGLPSEWNMRRRTRWYRDRAEDMVLAGLTWEWSINAMGTCCHLGTIPPYAITRVAYITPKACGSLVWHGMDPTITILNYQIVGRRYRSMSRWIFGDAPLPGDEPKEVEALVPNRKGEVTRRPDYQLPDPIDGIEVVTVDAAGRDAA